jgi:hypothetical protein
MSDPFFDKAEGKKVAVTFTNGETSMLITGTLIREGNFYCLRSVPVAVIRGDKIDPIDPVESMSILESE